MNTFRITLDGVTFEVEILGDPAQDELEVRVDGETFQVRICDAERMSSIGRPSGPLPSPTPLPIPTSVPSAAPAVNGSQLVSPLPGTIISISVQTGQHVDAGDELLVIEAMKMNNRIRSPRSGTVSEVLVQVGQRVNHGSLLLAWQI
jgi:biotin carboxyl carrier protein